MKEQLQLKNHLKEVRTEANLSQAQLAEMVDLHEKEKTFAYTGSCGRNRLHLYSLLGGDRSRLLCDPTRRPDPGICKTRRSGGETASLWHSGAAGFLQKSV